MHIYNIINIDVGIIIYFIPAVIHLFLSSHLIVINLTYCSAINYIRTKLQRHRFMRQLDYRFRYSVVPNNSLLFIITLQTSIGTTVSFIEHDFPLFS